MTRRLRDTMTVAAIIVVSIVMMTGPADGVLLSGDGATTSTTATTVAPVTVIHRTVMTWSCPSDTDMMTADGRCHELDAWMDEWMVDNGPPVHPADGCAEDESWTVVHYLDPRGQTTPDSTVSRACIHNDTIQYHLDDVTRSMDEWTRQTEDN